MATWKILGMVLLVVVPGGSLVLLALALYQAHKHGVRPGVWLSRQFRARVVPALERIAHRLRTLSKSFTWFQDGVVRP
jgi:hypothetical protein